MGTPYTSVLIAAVCGCFRLILIHSIPQQRRRLCCLVVPVTVGQFDLTTPPTLFLQLCLSVCLHVCTNAACTGSGEIYSSYFTWSVIDCAASELQSLCCVLLSLLSTSAATVRSHGSLLFLSCVKLSHSSVSYLDNDSVCSFWVCLLFDVGRCDSLSVVDECKAVIDETLDVSVIVYVAFEPQSSNSRSSLNCFCSFSCMW